ncbi:hypothetical protein [Paenibacillus xylaniclasticus]|uniref:hypothetical protein n=1 Tax=Paenibacillus xylaniclasticus TaxID=588083 RepID=UPI000FDC5E11|nr:MULTISPECIES: hypothetical protein [Paenibacillus]GFN32448.1 hypothetical protein PCURB6_27080 [Paenibacillus curdlanolyticus]
MTTVQDACELVSRYMFDVAEVVVTADDIYYETPSGELSHIHYWYEAAQLHYGLIDIHDSVDLIPNEYRVLWSSAYARSKDADTIIKYIYINNDWVAIDSFTMII